MRIAVCCLCIAIPFYLSAQKKYTVTSPDKNLVFTFYNDNAKAAYTVAYKKQLVVDKSFLSLAFKDGSFSDNLAVGKPVYRDSVEDYDLLTGKASHVHDAYKEMIIPMRSTINNINIQLA